MVYTDTRTGEEYEQPAGIVVLSAYVFGNISLLLHSGIGEPYDPATQKGAVGQELLLPALAHGRDDVLRGQELQPVHGRARAR